MPTSPRLLHHANGCVTRLAAAATSTIRHNASPRARPPNTSHNSNVATGTSIASVRSSASSWVVGASARTVARVRYALVTTMGRGADPEDAELFAPRWVDTLRLATAELSWLASRGYAEPSAVALVGNRHELRQRQREAMRRAAARDDAVKARHARRVTGGLAGASLQIDGFNCLITLEAALAGAPVFRGRDGTLRDIASVHGNWRRVATTDAALRALAAALVRCNSGEVRWLLDRPVSRSAELADAITALGEQLGQSWRCELVFDPDGALAVSHDVIATSDAGILDRCGAWIDLVSLALAHDVPDAWCLDLRETSG